MSGVARLGCELVPSRTLVAPGVRTLPRVGWRADAGAALSFVTSRPDAWLLGTLAFFLRGGIVLLAVPIVVLPTQVEARQLLGANLGSNGLTPGFWSAVAAAALLSIVVAIGILYVLARLEERSFRELIADPRTPAALARLSSPAFVRHAARRLRYQLFAVQVLTFLVLIACAAPLVHGINAATTSEILRPSSSESIYLRVLGAVGTPLFALVAVLIVIEPISGSVSRALLVRTADGTPITGRAWLWKAFRIAAARLLRSPLRIIAVSATGWLLTIGLVGGAMLILGAVWQTTRAAFLSATSFTDVGDDVAMLAAATALSAAFILGSLLAGIGSAARGALWSVEALR